MASVSCAAAPAVSVWIDAKSGVRYGPLVCLALGTFGGSFQYLGLALKAAVGSVTLATGGLDDLGWVGGACVLAAFMLFLATDRRAHPPASGTNFR